VDERKEAVSVATDNNNEPRWLGVVRRSWPVAVLVAIVAMFGGIKDVSEGFDRLLIMLHLKPDALELARDTARGQFSDDLTRTAWKRLFWTRRYASAVEFKLSDAETTEIWKGYMGAVEEWNENLMINIMGLGRYYNLRKSSEFEDGIVPLMNSIHSCILKLRYAAAYTGEDGKTCRFPYVGSPLPPNTQAILGEANALNSQLYCFVNGLGRKGEGCEVKTMSDSGYQDQDPVSGAWELPTQSTKQ